MKQWINNFDELTECQRIHAREQYIELRSGEDEISDEEYLKKEFGYEGNLMDMHNDQSITARIDEKLRYKKIEIDTEDEFYIYVNL